MVRVGITGGLGAGKSAALAILGELGAATASADDIANQMISRGGPAYAPVAARFPDAVKKDGTLDHARLAAKVFGDARSLAWLDGLVHPLVARRIDELMDEWARGGAEVAAIEVPLLLEAGLAGCFDVVVVVTTPMQTRMDRLLAAGWSAADAKRRIAAQADDEQRLAIADEVLDNAGSMAILRRATRALWRRLAKEPR